MIPVSNGERIRSMTDEELAAMYTNFMNDVLEQNGMTDEFELDSRFAAMMLDWLKQPYMEESDEE